MSKEILLTIPDDMYSQVRDHAEKTNQPLDRYILDILANSFEREGTNLEVNQVSPFPDNAVDQEKAAYFAIHKSLWQKYPGYHVAIFNGEMVDHDMDGFALSKRIYKHYRDQFVLIRQVEQEQEPVLYFRSPRFETAL